MNDFSAAREELLGWFIEGQLKRTETLVKGTIEDAPSALVTMFDEKNIGKLLLQINDLDV
jgi:NADPH-dependent curcumin reductase CurA